MAPAITVKQISASELETFIRLPWRLYRGDRNWVPPMLFDLHRRFSPKRNPWFEHSEAAFFLAFRGGEPVGRISAQVDANYDRHWGPGAGHFGWFEADDDQEIADALFAAAAGWLRSKGRTRMMGPFNFNINEESGLLIDGFDSPPMVLMTYNPRYYPAFFDRAGFGKAQDLFAYRLDATVEAPADVKNYAEHIRHQEGIVIREWDFKNNFQRDLKLFHEVYNSAWEQNWGSVLLTDQELNAQSFELRWLTDPHLAFFAETSSGEVMGASLTLPNLNEYFIQMNGQLYNLLPSRWHGLLVKKRFHSCRVFALGVKKEFRRSGVGAVFYYDTLMAAKRLGYHWGEMSWILESNQAMNRAIQHMGGKVYKTYRVYEKAI
jgi:hypothetical protein